MLSYNIENEHALIAICTVAPESKPTPVQQPFIPPMSTGGQNPGNPLGVPMGNNMPNMAQSLNDPMFSSMMNMMMQNPQMMEMIINSNPMLKQMIDANPQLKEIMTNPELMKSMFTPENLQMAQNMSAMMGQQHGSTLSGSSEPFPLPGNLSQPSVNPQPSINPRPQNPFLMYRPLAPQFNLPRPYVSPMVNSYGNTFPPQVNVNVDYKALYGTQLSQMKEMGFVNEEVNLEALKVTNGNVNAAVERILNMIH